MRVKGNELQLSATDLANHLGCRHLTNLDHRVAHGVLERPKFVDPVLKILAERGLQHEAEYLAHLRGQGRDVVELVEGDTAAGEKTVAAMRNGADVIFQAALRDGCWQGRADFLIRTDLESNLGPFSYEVYDAKLARSTRAGTILQLSLYSDMVRAIQGKAPDWMHVVKPGADFEPESFRCDEFGAYYRWVKSQIEVSVAGDDHRQDPATYPEPVPQCDICRWRPRCNRQRRGDDHLSLVAGMQTMHAREFVSQGKTTLEQLGDSAEALRERPPRGHIETYERLRDQARVQLVGRRESKNVVERRPLEDSRGLAILPEPSPGDVFFDIEGDAFFGEGGLEYLLGYAFAGEKSDDLDYRAFWAMNLAEEKRAFEQFVDAMLERWEQHSGMHIYHFAHYEPSALKRLMGKHGTRENKVDRMLRGGLFVDLHAATRQGLRASVERYGLKELEPFFGFGRDVDLQQAGLARRRVEWALELGRPGEVVAADHDAVEGYNRDDCVATAALRDWLETVRAEWETEGITIPRPDLRSGEASEGVKERRAEVAEVFDPLVAGLPEDQESWSEVDRARWLLAHSLDYFRRENNVVWWEFFERRKLELEDAFGDRKAVGGLVPLGVVGETGKRVKKPIYRYRFPPQDLSFGEGDELHEPGGDADREPKDSQIGSVHEVHEAEGLLDLVKDKGRENDDPNIVFVHKLFGTEALEKALLSLGRWVVTNGIDTPGTLRAGRDLLLRRPPRLVGGSRSGPFRGTNETPVEAAVRLVQELDHGLLAIQGPPGAGKTHAGAKMILELVRQGKRLGVTAVGHKVIANLLKAALKMADEEGVAMEAAHKVSKRSEDPGSIAETTGNATAEKALDEGRVLGGTAWLWARDEFEGELDYLFVDEAGQMSLANVLAASRAAKNLILLGDPAQLEQPQQGAHPDGTEVSALKHLLGKHKTMPPDQGLFLDRTWRLHPDICGFTSELHYEGLLESREGLEKQELRGDTPFAGAGLFHVSVIHDGNQSSSPEEVAAVTSVIQSLQRDGLTWVNGDGEEAPLESEHILIVAPYNAQISALKKALPGIKIGTVDKFQGQEAPVVIFSMTSSSPEDAPRGLSFLYNPNRLNVATSRARCAVILVANPRLFEPECHSPEQMRWANGLCRFRELATEVNL